ncbi:MAG: DUF6542 domain-containing protein [Streptosporangiaceae bacterium]
MPQRDEARPQDVSRGWAQDDPRGRAEVGSRGRAADRGRVRRPRWGNFPGRLGVCVVIGSAALGALLTALTNSEPGGVLGVFLVGGTILAALAVRPRTGYLIIPIPALSYLVAALIAGMIYNRNNDGSSTAVALNAAQWIASGFVAMAVATGLAIVITALRWQRKSSLY